MTEADLHRLAAIGTKLAWEGVRPWLIAKALNRLFGTEFGYVDALVMTFLANSLGSAMEQGRRTEDEAHDAIVAGGV